MPAGAAPSATDTLAALQLVSQVNSFVGSASNALGGGGSGLRDLFREVNQVEVEVKGESGRQEEEHVVAPTEAEPQRTYNLRMCVHSCVNLPRDATYVLIRIGQGSEAECTYTSPVASESTHPVWEYSVEHEVKFGYQPPKLEILVMGKRLVQLADPLLGGVAIGLPAGTSDGPQRQELTLMNVSQSLLPSCTPGKQPKVHVVWQLCEPTTFVPDLNRVAEMDHDAVEKETHTVSVKLLSLSLKRPMPQQKVCVTFRIRKPTIGHCTFPVRTSPTMITWPRGQVMETSANLVTGQLCTETCWFGGGKSPNGAPLVGWACEPWTVRESRVALLSHMLEATAHTISQVASTERGSPPVEKLLKLGTWREPLGDLMDCIVENDRVMRFDAKLTTRDGQNLGLLRFELDVFTDEYHRPPPPLTLERLQAEYKKLRLAAASEQTVSPETPLATMSVGHGDVYKKEVPVQVRGGLPSQEMWQHTRMYYCTIFADGLHCLDRNASPFVRITMGAHSATTDDAHRVGCFNDIRWHTPVAVASKVINRRAKIELFGRSGSSTLGFTTEELLGEQTLYDVSVGRLCWMHLFGGAVGAPKKDVARQMAKGAVRPASTYQGTIAVYFGTSRKPQSYFQQIMDERTPCWLVVRLYYGAYLKAFANKRVKVLVQVAGCRLPDEREAARSTKVLAEGVNVHVTRDKKGSVGFQFAGSKGQQPRISRIEPDRQDLQPMAVGDIIGAVDGQPVGSADDLKLMVASLKDFVLTVRKRGGIRGLVTSRELETTGTFCCAPELAANREGPDPRHFNRNLVSFQGYVNQDGVLRFLDSPPSAKGGKTSTTTDPAPVRAWVERRTPRSFPLRVPPGVTHAYLYLVVNGEEEKPPSLFGRLRLGDAEPHKVEPRWKMLRYDASVISPPPAHWPNSMAGFILGSAALSASFSSGGQEAIPPSKWQTQDIRSPPPALVPAIPGKVQAAPVKEIIPPQTPSLPSAKELVSAKILPRATRDPMCMPCKVCNPEVMLNVGSPGAPSDVSSAIQGQRQRIYCHIDVLAARDLPAMDDDGLSNPCYKIQVLDKTIWNPGGESKSLSPSFMHRVVIPFEASVSIHPSMNDCLTVPLPPVVCSLCDRDNMHVLGRTVDTSYETMGTVVIKHQPRVRDDKTVFPMLGLGSGGRLDLNTSHQAIWHALDKPAHIPFDAASGGHEGSWERRARVLLAIGYSFHEEQPDAVGEQVDYEGTGGTIRKLCTQESARIAINIDLLGLRNLPEDLHNAKLHLSSFWEGQEADFDIGSGMFAMRNLDPNFPQEGWEPETTEDDIDWQTYWGRMGPFLKIMDGSKLQVATPMAQEEDDGVPTALLEDLVGIRVKAPTYEVPIIPYLQTVRAGRKTFHSEGSDIGMRNGHNKMLPLAKGVPGKLEPIEMKQPFLLLPGITFQLRNFLTNMHYGAMTVGLNSLPVADVDVRPGGWAEACIDDYHAMPEELRCWKTPDGRREGSIVYIKDMKIMENAYETFVDVFASDRGDLTWDPDMHIGRCLRSPMLFTLLTGDGQRVPQYFNPGDWMCGDEQFKSEPFDDRVSPSLWLGDGPKSRCRSPLGPGELFKDFLYHSRKDKSYLQQKKTGDLKRCLAEEGWRAPTHLAAPESLATDLNPLAANRSGNLQYNNTHTFIRPVGHIIHSDDRDSRLLARLRMGLPIRHMEKLRENMKAAHSLVLAIRSGEDGNLEDAELWLGEAAKALEASEEVERNHMGTNFLVVKFSKPGLVIWAAPDEVNVWDRPGALLLAVRLQEDHDTIVPVFVPSFDLRFCHETAWYPRKTLLTRFRHLEAQIGKKKREQEAQLRAKAAAVRQSPPGAPPEARRKAVSLDTRVDEIIPDDGDDDGAVTNLAGYDRPIRVAKGAFICRIRQRAGTVYFDRRQARGWFRTVLGAALPELQEDLNWGISDSVYAEQALSEFMNLRRPLVTGSDQAGSAMLKGHIRVQRCDPSMPLCKQVNIRQRPFSNLWIKRSVFVNVTVLTAHKLELSSVGLLKPYLVVKLGSETQTTTPKEDRTTGRTDILSFYDKFTFETTLPGRTRLTVQLWHQGMLSDTCMGSTTVDLEDRWMALKWREFRTHGNKEFLRKTVSPKVVTYCSQSPHRKYSDAKRTKLCAVQEGWTDPDEPAYLGPSDGGYELKPHRAPEDTLPIECADLMREDEDTSAEEKVGTLRLLVDLSSHTLEGAPRATSQDFVIILTIWEVNNIQLFKDWGERNDVYIQGRFRCTDYWGKECHELKFTDTHKFARNKACFNWRWVFTVRAPVAECSLELLLFDSDRISVDDAIYDPKVYPLDHMLLLACQNHRDGKPSLGKLAETVIFDSWPEQGRKPPWPNLQRLRCCRRAKSLQDSTKFARMRMDVEVLPKGEAIMRPLEEGQVSQPAGRLNLSTAVSDFSTTASIILGPMAFRNLRFTCVASVVLIALLVIFALLYYILMVYQLI